MNKNTINAYKDSLQELKTLSKDVFVGRKYLSFLIPELGYIEDEQNKVLEDLYQMNQQCIIPKHPDDYEVHEQDYTRKLKR